MCCEFQCIQGAQWTLFLSMAQISQTFREQPKRRHQLHLLSSSVKHLVAGHGFPSNNDRGKAKNYNRIGQIHSSGSKVCVSLYYRKMEIQTKSAISIIQGDQRIARSCYITACKEALQQVDPRYTPKDVEINEISVERTIE